MKTWIANGRPDSDQNLPPGRPRTLRILVLLTEPHSPTVRWRPQSLPNRRHVNIGSWLDIVCVGVANGLESLDCVGVGRKDDDVGDVQDGKSGRENSPKKDCAIKRDHIGRI